MPKPGAWPAPPVLCDKRKPGTAAGFKVNKSKRNEFPNSNQTSQSPCQFSRKKPSQTEAALTNSRRLPVRAGSPGDRPANCWIVDSSHKRRIIADPDRRAPESRPIQNDKACPDLDHKGRDYCASRRGEFCYIRQDKILTLDPALRQGVERGL